MPFTLSHPAILLPLAYLPRHWYSITGLVIGSMTPDFEYFIRMKVKSDYSHTISGLLWFDLPLGLLLAFIYHNMVRYILLENLPKILKSRISNFKNINWNEYFKSKWLVVITSILFGAASHLLWDSFSHDSGYFVKAIPALTNSVDIAGKQIPFFKIVQHTSSLLGGLVIALAILKLPNDNIVSGQVNYNYWLLLTILFLTVIVTRLLTGLDIKLYGNLVVTSISAGLIALILTSLLLKTRFPR